MGGRIAALVLALMAAVLLPSCTQAGAEGTGPDLVESAATKDDAARTVVRRYFEALPSGDESETAAVTTERFRDSVYGLDGVEAVDVIAVEADTGPYKPEEGQCAFRVECELDFGKNIYGQNGVYTWWVLVSRDASGTWLLDDAGL